jgi:hypothetical protein
VWRLRKTGVASRDELAKSLSRPELRRNWSVKRNDNLMVLETKEEYTQEDIGFDPKRNWCVVSIDRKMNISLPTPVNEKVEMSAFQPYVNGSGWYPGKIVRTLTVGNSLQLKQICSIASVRLLPSNSKADEFKIKIPPGFEVYDKRIGAKFKAGENTDADVQEVQ